MKEVLRNRLTYVALILPSLIALLFLAIFLPAIDRADQNLKGFHLDIVNEGGASTAALAHQLAMHVPFSTKLTTRDVALQDVSRDTAQMVVVIPNSFATDVQHGRAKLTFILNGAAPTSTQSLLESAESKLVEAVNDAVYAKAQSQVRQALKEQIGASAVATRNGTAHPMLPDIPRTLVVAKTTYVHHASSRTASLVPFLLLITSFIGAMAMSVVSYQAISTIRRSGRILSTLGMQTSINVLTSAIVGLVWLGALHLANVTEAVSFWGAWAYLSLAEFLMLCVIQLFVYLLGLPGLALGLLLFPLQLVTSGVLVPKQLLPAAYNDLAAWLPGGYLIDLANRVYDGSPLPDHFWWVAIAFIFVAMAAVVGRTCLDGARQRRQPVQ
jgi:ABC-type multidrug transport system permease subunit